MTLSNQMKKELLKLVREEIRGHFEGTPNAIYEKLKMSPELQETNGIFVTLKKSGNLRGCIGNIVAERPFVESIKSNAIQSAFHDPRFPPLGNNELENLDIEISILTKPEPVSDYHDIRIGIDGVILQKGYNGAVFLPQVAPEQGWDLETTLTHLSMKAGMSPGEFKNDSCTFQVFQAIYFSESEIE